MKEEKCFRRVDEPTPNGGIYSIAYFRDKNWNPCTEDKAEIYEIVEFDEKDNPFFRTYGFTTLSSSEE